MGEEEEAGRWEGMGLMLVAVEGKEDYDEEGGGGGGSKIQDRGDR